VIVNRLRANPFSASEQQALKAWLRSGRDIPGFRLFSELEENQAALSRLVETVPLPLIKAPEVEGLTQSSVDVVHTLVHLFEQSLSNAAAGGGA
jgi:hypothetical protein